MLTSHIETGRVSPASLPQVVIAVVVGSRLYGDIISSTLQASPGVALSHFFSSTKAAARSFDTAGSDVILLDPSMPNALEFVRQLSQEPVHIVCLTAPESDELIIAFTKAGVAGFAPRNCSAEQLADVVVAAKESKFPCDSEVRMALASHVATLATHQHVMRNDQPMLTERETEILGCIANGRSNKNIAAELFISVSTVKHHVHNLLEKLGASNRTEAVSVARELALV